MRTLDQFEANGCDNCESVLRKNRDIAFVVCFPSYFVFRLFPDATSLVIHSFSDENKNKFSIKERQCS